MNGIHGGLKTLLGATLALAAGGAAAQTVTTFAGSGTAGYAEGNATAASFHAPQGVSVGPWGGDVYVADTANARIRKITAGGVVSTFADLGGGYPNHPTGVAVDGLGRVWEVDPIGDGIDGGILNALSADGHILMTNLQWPSVPLPPLTADDAIAIATDRSGNLYVTSYLSGVLRFDTKGKGSVLATGLLSAQGISVDASGIVFIADTDRNRIMKVTADGAVTTLAGSGRPGNADGAAYAASFRAPAGIAVDATGAVYVSDTGNNTIRRISADGVVTTLAGSGTAGNADGVGPNASFNGPRGLGLSSAGDLYVADTGNNKIRRIVLGISCAVGCTDWTVPSVARTAGPNGSFWTSDLTVHNRGPFAVPMTLKFLGHDTDGSAGPENDVTIGPYQTVTYADVLASVFGIGNGWGAVQVRTGSDRIAVRSRTSTLRAGGSVGDGLPGVRTDRFFTAQTVPDAVLTGLREDDRFRTNLILVNGTATPVDVLVTAIDSTGTAVGSRTYTLRPFEMTQDARFLARAEFAAARTDVTVSLSTTTPGGAFTGYAAVIDNGSNAPTTVLPQ